ncbi:MAG TPA: DUF302 domain-containing protein [Acidobacteriaceae bacterium]|nr:DUF302 domain-containing protein [Acidobacteriaceae bacterium]
MKEANTKGFESIQSPYAVSETVRRLEAVLAAKGIPVMGKINHAAGALAAGIPMRPTEVLIFGNAKAGTPIMLAAPSAAIDLPLKALIWEDADGLVWVSYNAPEYLQQRHQFPAELIPNIAGIRTLIEAAVRQ